MVGVRVEIRRFVDDHQPGWVECAFADVHGHEWVFIEKVPVVSSENLDAASTYPRLGVIACEVIARNVRSDEQEAIVVDTTQPWGIEATTGDTRFEVAPGQLEEFDHPS